MAVGKAQQLSLETGCGLGGFGNDKAGRLGHTGSAARMVKRTDSRAAEQVELAGCGDQMNVVEGKVRPSRTLRFQDVDVMESWLFEIP